MKIETVSMDDIPELLRNGRWVDVIKDLKHGQVKKLSMGKNDPTLQVVQCRLISAARYCKIKITTRIRENNLYVWLKPQAEGRDERGNP